MSPLRQAFRGFRRRWLAGTVLLLLIGAASPAAGGSSRQPAVLLEGEVLTYNVRYGPFDLGQVKIRTFGKAASADGVAFAARADINSYPKVPFVDLHAVFESQIDTAVFSHAFSGRLKEGERWDFSRYRYDYRRGRVYMEVGRHDTLISKRDTLSITGTCQDGLALFFFAREHLMSGKRMNVPAVVKERLVNTMIDFTGNAEAVDLDDVEYPIAARHFTGTMEFEGIFGLTGDFEGWFSDDDARVPIIAKLKVLIGSVTVELMEWKRSAWSPPRALP